MGAKRLKDVLPPLVCAFTALGVYITTLTPGVFWGDGAELTVNAYVLGISHPPGYPLYMLLGKLFISLTPIKGVAYSMNLLSALLGGLTVGVVFLISRRVAGSPLIAAVTALSFAFSYRFWRESIITEVYTLHALFLSLILLFLLLWRDTGRKRYAYLAAGTFGLSLAHHGMTALLLPGLLYGVFGLGRHTFTVKALMVLSALALIGLPLYAYLPLRFGAEPPLDLARVLGVDLTNPGHFLWYVSGSLYRPALTASTLDSAYHQAGIALAAVAVDYIVLGAFLAYLGAIIQYMRDPRALVLTLLLFAPNLIFMSVYKVGDIEDFTVFLTLISIVWFAVGAQAVRSWLSLALGNGARTSAIPDSIRRALPAAGLAVLPLLGFSINLRHLDYSDARGPETFARETLAALPSDAVVLTQYPGWPVWYSHIVEGLRPDVAVLDPRLFLAGRWIFAGMTAGEQWVPALSRELERYDGRPLYTVLYDPYVATAWAFEAEGDLYKLKRKEPPRVEPLTPSAVKDGPLFGGSLRLRDAQIEPSTTHPGSLVRLHTSWIVEAAPQGDYQLDFYFDRTALQEPGGSPPKSRNFSYRVPQGHGEFPSSRWPPGCSVDEVYDLYIPESVGAGIYTVFLSLVEYESPLEYQGNTVAPVFNGGSGPFSRIPLVEINVISPKGQFAD